MGLEQKFHWKHADGNKNIVSWMQYAYKDILTGVPDYFIAKFTNMLNGGDNAKEIAKYIKERYKEVEGIDDIL